MFLKGLSPAHQRALFHALHLEWETARNMHPDPSIRALKPPVFSLHQGKKILGKWSIEKREISLSLGLVLNHGWDTIREVLFHEMAHQLAHELYGAFGEKPHGPAFLKACRLLGANPKASGSFAPLKERLQSDAQPAEDALTSRIRKLFALSQSSNTHESQLALAKAHALMEKHQIQTLKKNKEKTSHSNFITIFLGEPTLRHHREFYALANFLTEHCFVRCVWTMACVLEKGKMGRALEISGTAPQVLSAEYTYGFIVGAIDRAWETFCQKVGHNPGRYRKSDFAEGMIEGFSEKLRQEKTDNASRALDIIRDPFLDDYLAIRYPRIVSRTSRGRRVSPEFMAKGRQEGKKLSLAPGLDKKVPPKPKLIARTTTF